MSSKNIEDSQNTSGVTISAEPGILLRGFLVIPPSPSGTVIFAHGSGSSRFSPRNQQVAQTLNEAGLATLLFDLLTPEEAEDRQKVFDIPFLADRLNYATKWVQSHEVLGELPVGYFGASTGAGAALWAAAGQGNRISAVVSRGGRPDLALPKLSRVDAPVLLIVGGDDEPVIEMNKDSLKDLRNGELTIVPNATHLFEEPGALETVARQATWWFMRHLKKAGGEAAA